MYAVQGTHQVQQKRYSDDPKDPFPGGKVDSGHVGRIKIRECWRNINYA